MEKQITEVEQGKLDWLIMPDPRLLEDLIEEHPLGVAKVKGVDLSMGDVSDEHFRLLKHFTNLQQIIFYDAHGADAFLKNIRAMPSVLEIQFSQTPLTDEGMRAVASFPHLKRLQIDYYFKNVSLEPLRGHPSIEKIVLYGLPIDPKMKDVFSSLPKLINVVEEEGN